MVSCGYKEAREKVFKRQIGSYVLDIQRTDLGKFKNDSLKYKNLKITFYKDSTFKTNMAVPFLYEEKGKWIVDAGSIDSWNWLSYKSWLKNKEINIGDGSQFTHLYKSGNDSIFYINSATPKKNQDFIQEIYFKKTTSWSEPQLPPEIVDSTKSILYGGQ